MGDLGRPGRRAFIEALLAGGVREKAAAFETVDGWLPGAHRHELIARATSGQPLRTQVGLIGDAKAARVISWQQKAAHSDSRMHESGCKE